MMSKRSIVWLAYLSYAVVGAPAWAGGIDSSVLPRCWSVTSTYEADDDALNGFGERFGAELEALSNVKIDAGGISLQANIVVCSSPAAARKVHEFFMSARNATAMKYARDENIVYEFLCDNRGVLGKIHEVLGLYPRFESSYRVTMEVAPLAGGDDSKWNALFNALLARRQSPDDEGIAASVRELAAGFEFAGGITLRNERPDWGSPSYAFSVTPESESKRGDLLAVAFPALPRDAGVPRVAIEANVPVRAFSVYQPDEPVNTYNLTRATDAWPAASPELERVFANEWNPDATTMEKIEYLLCWVFENIEYSGDVVGSRYGTLNVLQQGYGHCWDKSDVFVSVCRRAGIPAREVMGWHLQFNQGHVWTEVYDESSGWVSVDPSASWIGVDELYVPLFILEDGPTPFVYTSMPQVVPQRSAR